MALHNLVESVEMRDDKKWYAIVVFTTDDGSFKVRQEYILDPPNPGTLTNLVLADMSKFETQVLDPLGVKALLLFKGQEIAVPEPPEEEPPTGEELARRAWFLLVNQLRAAQALSPGTQFLTDLQAQIDQTFKPEYVS